MAPPRRRLRIALLLLSPLLVGALWLTVEILASRRALHRYRAELLAQGDKLDPAALAPDPGAEALQAGRHYTQAGQQLVDPGGFLSRLPAPLALSWQSSPGQAAVIWSRPHLADSNGHSNSWSALAAFVEQNAPALEELRATLQPPAIAFQLDYTQGFNLLLPHLARQKPAVNHLWAAVLHHLHKGDTRQAFPHLLSLVDTTKPLQSEPLLISQLVRIAVATISVGVTWQALQAEPWTDDQLALLQQRWASLEFLTGMEKALTMERAMAAITFQQLRSNADQLRQFQNSQALLWGTGPTATPATPNGLSEVPEFVSEVLFRTLRATGSWLHDRLWQTWWSYDDERHYLEVTGAMIAAAHDARQAAAPACQRLRDQDRRAENAPQGYRYLLSSSLVGSGDSALRKAAGANAQVQLVVTAIALRRHQLRHGRFPPDLQNLVPEILPEIPRDPMDGAPLRYRSNPDGTFLLYSVNEDGKDDGGNPEPANPSGGAGGRSVHFTRGKDMVWPRAGEAVEPAPQKKDSKVTP